MARGLTPIVVLPRLAGGEGQGGHDLYYDRSLTACPMRSCLARETARVIDLSADGCLSTNTIIQAAGVNNACRLASPATGRMV